MRVSIRSGRLEVQHEVPGRCCQKTVGFRDCDCRRGKLRRVRTAGIVFRESEHWPEDSDTVNSDEPNTNSVFNWPT